MPTLPTALAALAALVAMCDAAAAAAAAKRPNLLFMMSDQQRSDTLGAVVPSLHTPNLDRIATEGALFK